MRAKTEICTACASAEEEIINDVKKVNYIFKDLFSKM